MGNFSKKSFLAGALLTILTVFVAAYFMKKTGTGVFKRPSAPPENILPAGAALDNQRRLIAWPSKVEVACPEQDISTAVLLILGQSNAGNHGGSRIQARHPDKVINYYEGKCYRGGSPLLGGSGQGGEPWTALADLLIDSGAVKTAVLAPLAVSGSSISRWASGGDLNRTLTSTVTLMSSRYKPTHVLWVQGESDFARNTPGDSYRSGLLDVVHSLRKAGTTAPFYVAVASKCLGNPHWVPANDIAAAQRSATGLEPDVVSGPDMDNILSTEDRYDGCHLSEPGLVKTAQAWATILKKN